MEPGIVLVVAGVACVFAAILAAAGAFILTRRAAKWISAGLALTFVLVSVGLFIRAPLVPANSTAPVADNLTLISAVNGRGGATLSALSARDGTTARWRHSAGTFISAAPVVRGGVVYVTDQQPGGNGASVSALRLADGSTLWHSAFSTTVLSAPAVADGHVYIAALRLTTGPPNRQIVALDAASGKELWRQSAGDSFFFSPDSRPLAAAGGLVIMGGGAAGAAGVVALRAADGQIAWTVPPAPDGSLANVTISDDMVLVLPTIGPLANQQVTALRLADGDSLWTLSAAGSTLGALTIASGALYIAARDNSAITSPSAESAGWFVNAYALRDGSLRWRHPAGGPTLSLAGDGDTLFVSTTQALHALRASDGSELWQRDGAYNTLLAAPGALFAVSTAVPDGPRLCPLTPCSGATIQLSALSLRDGSPYWNIQTDSPPLVALAGT